MRHTSTKGVFFHDRRQPLYAHWKMAATWKASSGYTTCTPIQDRGVRCRGVLYPKRTNQQAYVNSDEVVRVHIGPLANGMLGREPGNHTDTQEAKEGVPAGGCVT